MSVGQRLIVERGLLLLKLLRRMLLLQLLLHAAATVECERHLRQHPGVGLRLLQLRLMLKNTADYQTLRATLKTVDDGATVWSSPRLQAKGTGAQKSLTLNIPAQQLKRGDYEVLLSGTTASGADEEITSYYFSVVK